MGREISQRIGVCEPFLFPWHSCSHATTSILNVKSGGNKWKNEALWQPGCIQNKILTMVEGVGRENDLARHCGKKWWQKKGAVKKWSKRKDKEGSRTGSLFHYSAGVANGRVYLRMCTVWAAPIFKRHSGSIATATCLGRQRPWCIGGTEAI